VEEFIKSMREASHALLVMSMRWDELSREDNQKVQALKGWSVAFNLSLDEVPFEMQAMVEELEKGGK